MPDSTASSLPIDLSELQDKFTSGNPKKQLEILPQIVAAGATGIEVLTNWLDRQQGKQPTIVTGAVYQALYASSLPQARVYIERELPTGIVPLRSSREIDYLPLQQLLAAGEFQAADKLTTEKLCELAGTDAIQRKWIYFTEVEQLPQTDLQTIDALWKLHSEGKFGFSIQREIWMGTGKNWEKLWVKIGWKNGNTWTRYPGSFTWNLTAPPGHLPLSNQLRGVRVMSSLLSHPAWSQQNS